MPVFNNLCATVYRFFAKYMGMAPDHFFGNRLRYAGQVEFFALPKHSGNKNNMKQHVAQFFADSFGIPGFNGIG